MGRPRSFRRTPIAVVAAALAVALGGCGLGPGPGTSDVTLTVTRNFGSQQLGSVSERRVPGGETVLSMLERHYRITTRYGGDFVESIDGRSGTPDHYDWFFYVDGVEATRGAGNTPVRHGEQVWWDLHDWSATDSIPAVVGSFPEPFTTGIGGQRYPTTLECATGFQSICDRVGTALHRDGVPVADQLLGTGSGADALTIVVAPFSALEGSIAGGLIDDGPRSSGVYARFTEGGRALELLNPHGQTVRVLGAGAGLIAATEDQVSKPEWLITGTDSAGVAAAAAALTPARLHDRFALAVDDGTDFALPLQPSL